MTLTPRKICGVFATSFKFGPPTYFISHHSLLWKGITCCFLQKRLKKGRAQLFDCGVPAVMSKVTYVVRCAWC